MNKTRERIAKVTLILTFVAIYATLFFLQPLTSFVGDFIVDYNILCNYTSISNLVLTQLSYNPYYYGNFAYNLLVFINLTKFEMGTLFPKLVSFGLSILIIVLFVSCAYSVDDKPRPLRYIGMLVGGLVGINFFGIFETSSLIFIKLYIVNILLTYALLSASFKSKHLIVKMLLWFITMILQFFTFNPLLPVIVLILAIRNRKEQKSIITVPFVLLFLVFYVGLIYIYQGFNFFSNFSEITFENGHRRVVNVLSSLIVPLNRVDYSDRTRWLYMFAAIFGAFYLITYPIIAIKHKYKAFGLVSYFTLLGVVVLQIFNYKQYGYYYSQCYEINSLLVGIGIYYLIDDLAKNPIKKAAFKGNMYFDLKRIVSTATLSGIFVALLLSSQTLYKSNLNNSDPYNDLEYAASFDMGEVQSDLRGVFDDDQYHLQAAYDFYKKNGFIEADEQALEANDKYISLSSVNYIRGVEKDNKGQYWIGDNFAFEVYGNNYFLDLSLYTPAGANKVTIYANNNLLGSYELKANANNLVELKIAEYYHQNVIIRGYFESAFKGALNKEGLWACELIGLSYNNVYGLNPKQSDGLVWTTKKFGFYVTDINNSLDLSLYEPSSTSANSFTVSLNNKKIYQSEVKAGFNHYLIDIEKYKGDSGYFDIELDHVSASTSDARVLGVVYQGYSFVNITYEYTKTIDITGGFFTVNMNRDIFASAGNISFSFNNEDPIIYSSSYGYKYVLRTAKYIGQSVDFKIRFSNPLNNNGSNVSKNITFNQTNTMGFNYAESDGTIWSTNDFEICLESKQKGIKISYYELKDLLPNPYKVYINGKLVKQDSIKEESSSIIIDSKDFSDPYIYVRVVLDKKYVNPNDQRTLGFIYKGYQYVDLSYGTTKEYLVTSGFTCVTFPTSVAGKDNDIIVLINNIPITNFKYDKLSADEYIFYTKDLIGQTLSFAFNFKNPVVGTQATVDSKLSITGTDSIGLNAPESNGTIWTTKKFSFCIQNNHNVATFKFYEASELAPNPCKIYLNDILYDETYIQKDSSTVSVDTSVVDSEYVYITFELSNFKNDGRELGAIYNGFIYEDKVLHESKAVNITGGYTTVTIQNSLFVNSNKITFRIDGQIVPIYQTNGNSFILKTSDYIGKEVKLVMRFTKAISVYDLPYIQISSTNEVGLNEPEDNGTIWATKKFGFCIDNRSSLYSSVKYTLYEVESLNDNPIKAYLNGSLVYDGILNTHFNYITISLKKGCFDYVEFEIGKANNDGREITAILSSVEYIG